MGHFGHHFFSKKIMVNIALPVKLLFKNAIKYCFLSMVPPMLKIVNFEKFSQISLKLL